MALSPASKRLLPWLSGLVLAAGVIALVVSLVGNTGKSLETPRSSEPVVVPKKEKKVPLPGEARLVAAKFIQTAVLRQRLAESWQYTAPSLRAGYTRAEWEKGDIPVVPFPKKWFMQARMAVDYAYADRAQLQVAVLSKNDAEVKSQYFFLGLHRVGKGASARWLVDYWAPRGAPKIPISGS